MSTEESTFDTSRRRLLIVDDNVALVRVTQFAFDRAGFATQTAVNGADALELARQEVFDLVITDQQMPVMSGTELCANLRLLDNYRDTPIVMLTAKGLEMEIERLREEFAVQALFPKPFSPSAVVSAVEKMLAVAV
ncbi:response regulator [Adhaeretor mobilis]|uniref:Alkaline phosphatase synthesis transcriptional regulatory protein PhoP n=1 Tax=Adhaeretor mobilis TaxID=1930276 RepID=A0A517MVP0_9BACT|nr:response regulator [Adhaeretor mobilis]QDS98942.1 Alkaline phosphatase synthesis transcriptional regulatory protein PhoP [Adhaeretor mobilis]